MKERSEKVTVKAYGYVMKYLKDSETKLFLDLKRNPTQSQHCSWPKLNLN